jgi:hypothetical protein
MTYVRAHTTNMIFALISAYLISSGPAGVIPECTPSSVCSGSEVTAPDGVADHDAPGK